MDEVTDDLENGLGEYEGEAWDDNGTPNNTSDDTKIDAIIWRKNKDGTYSGIKIGYNEETGNWDLDGANKVSLQWMRDHMYLPKYADDPNPTGAWFVGGKAPGYTHYGFEKFARFDKNGKPDPKGEQKTYTYGKDTVGPGYFIPIPCDPRKQTRFTIPIDTSWP
jgi:hypothetical protein